MKLFNIFKRGASKEVKSNIEKINKNQLSNVVGGGDGATILNETSSTKLPASIRGVVIDK